MSAYDIHTRVKTTQCVLTLREGLFANVQVGGKAKSVTKTSTNVPLTCVKMAACVQTPTEVSTAFVLALGVGKHVRKMSMSVRLVSATMVANAGILLVHMPVSVHTFGLV